VTLVGSDGNEGKDLRQIVGKSKEIGKEKGGETKLAV
jgi:hypothetical protein